MLWAFAKALLLIAPEIWSAVRNDQLRARSQREVLNALFTRHMDRVQKAADARKRKDDGDSRYDRSA